MSSSILGIGISKMHIILTLFVGLGVLLGAFLGPFLIGYPVMRFLQKNHGYTFEAEVSWMIGAGISFFLLLAYAVGSLIV